MKQNVVTAKITQLIPAREQVTKGKDGVEKVKHIPAQVITAEYEAETDVEITAAGLANWLYPNLRLTQKMFAAQGKQGFKVSKEIMLELKVNNKLLTTATRLTFNDDRMFVCIDRQKELLMLVALSAMSPKIGASQKVISNFLLQIPENVVIAKSKKQLAINAEGVIEDAVLVNDNVEA